MAQFFRILLYSPRLTILAFLLITGGISGALKHRDNEKEASSPWDMGESDGSSPQTLQEVGGWGKDTKSAGQPAPPVAVETNPKLWKTEDGVIYEEEDVKALDPSEYE